MNDSIYYESLDELKIYLSKMENGIEYIINKFNENGKEAEGYYNLANLIEGINWVLNVIKLTTEFRNANSVYTNLANNELEALLPELLEGFENKDEILIMDLLEYELLPIVIKMKEYMKGSSL